MFYAHIKLSNDVSIKANADNLEFTAVCPVCGKEFPIDTQEYFDAWDGEIHCEACTKLLKPYTVYRPGEDFGQYDWLKILTQSEYPSALFIWALHHAPREALAAAADQFMTMVPGYHEDKPLGDINAEIAHREKVEKERVTRNG